MQILSRYSVNIRPYKYLGGYVFLCYYNKKGMLLEVENVLYL